MSALNFLFLNIYLFIVVESFNEIPSDKLNKKLSATMQTILCSTDSNTIHLLAIDKANFDEIDELIEWLNSDCSFKTIQLSAIEMIPTTTLQYHSEVTVFMVNARESIHLFLKAVTGYRGSNRHHRFLVVFKFRYDLSMLSFIFKGLARKTTFKIVVIMHDELGVSTLTYNPFDETFDNFTNTTEAEMTKDVFVRNRSDLRGRGRNLVVSMHEQNDRAVMKKDGRPGYTGVDGMTAELLEERYFVNQKMILRFTTKLFSLPSYRMNVTFIYTTPNEMYNGNKNSGVIGDLTLGNADMSFNADSLAPFLVSETLDVTEAIERTDMCILVPKAGDEPIVYNLLRTLSKTTWMVTLLSLFVMMLIYRYTQEIQKQIHSRKYSFYEYSWSEVSTIIFQSFFGDSITRIPISMPLRILIIGWCIYSFLITNAFQAKLISSLVLPKGLNDIETIEELGHSNLKIMYPKALANHINEYTDNRTMSILKDQLVEVESWSKFDAAICNKSLNTAFIMMRFHADLMVKRNFDKAAGRPSYKTMKECLLSFPRVYFLKLGSMYVDYMSELLRRFHEVGVIVKYDRYFDFVNALHGNIPVEDENDNVDESNIKVVITTDHLQTAFYLLFIGLIAASLAFIAEHFYFRREELKLKNNDIMKQR